MKKICITFSLMALLLSSPMIQAQETMEIKEDINLIKPPSEQETLKMGGFEIDIDSTTFEGRNKQFYWLNGHTVANRKSDVTFITLKENLKEPWPESFSGFPVLIQDKSGRIYLSYSGEFYSQYKESKKQVILEESTKLQKIRKTILYKIHFLKTR